MGKLKKIQYVQLHEEVDFGNSYILSDMDFRKLYSCRFRKK